MPIPLSAPRPGQPRATPNPPRRPDADGPLSARLRGIAALTWPQLLLLLCQFIIGITDVWAGGRLGADVQASIGLITQCQMLLMILCMATTGAAVAAVSQSLGAGRAARARRYVGLISAAAVGCGVGLALLGTLLRGPFLWVLGTPEPMLDTATVFFNATMWAMPGHYGMTIASALFRAAKSVKKPLWVGLAVCAINVAGDLGFGLGWFGLPACGAAGIAWSTCVAANLGALALFALLWRDGLLAADSRPRWRWVRRGAPYLLRVAGPALITSALWQTGYLVLFVITSTLPFDNVNALAGLTAGMRIEAILFLPAVAFNMTSAVLVGHCLGQGNHAEARRTALTILAGGVGVMTLVGAGLWPLRAALATALTPDPGVQVLTTAYLTYNILCVPFTVTSVILAGTFNGAGATIYPMWAFSLSIWGVRLPVAWLFGHLLWQSAEGVFLAMLVSQAVQSSFLLWVFLRRNWMRFAMRRAPHPHTSEVS